MRPWLTAVLVIAAPTSPLHRMTSGGPVFTVTSVDIHEGGQIALTFVHPGCHGENHSPQLSWHGAPAGAKSFAVTAYDPDAPTGSGWWHWLVYNLPASTTQLARGAGDASGKLLPRGASQGHTDYGTVGYGGPCPPAGKPHHYIFTVFALDVDHLDLPSNATAAQIGFNLNAHALATAKLTALYGI